MKSDEYSFIAKIYDPVLFPFLYPIRKAVEKELRQYKDRKILDLCCGTGDQLKFLTKKNYRNLHCLDLSASMLNMAKKNAEKINIYQKDATDTGFPEKEFDAVILSFAIHEKPVKVQKKMIEEAHRILKNEGILMIVDYIIDRKTCFIGKIGITVIERIAGKEHYRNFRNYLNHGGLSPLIQPRKWKQVKSLRKLFNGVGIMIFSRQT